MDSISELNEKVPFADLLGKTLLAVKNPNKFQIFFYTKDYVYCMSHETECCEYVRVEDICGDLDDLVGEVLQAEVVSNADYPQPEESEDCNWNTESFSWTFYKIATFNGYVTIRWLGEDNGYYSHEVEVYRRPYGLC